jgi:hypothetical protein
VTNGQEKPYARLILRDIAYDQPHALATDAALLCPYGTVN